MANKIITISRTFGSGGRLIGETLAKELGISYYDKKLLKLMSEKTGISEEGLENADEKLLNHMIDPYAIMNGQDHSTNLYLYKVEKQLIRDLAKKESCVIIGRLSDWILRDEPNVLKVFITAPACDRVKRIMQYENVGERQAKKLIRQVDKLRQNYYSFFTDERWMDPNNYDLIVNSSLMGVEGTVDLLKYIVK